MWADRQQSIVARPRIVIASGLRGVGVSTIAEHMQEVTSLLTIVDAGEQWADILEACTAGVERLLAVTTDDVVSVAATYALIKRARDQFPGVAIEVLVNRSGARDALRTYERVQGAAVHFLGETVGFGGAIPDSRHDEQVGDPEVRRMPHHKIERTVILAMHDVARRLDEELEHNAASQPLYTLMERR